MAIVQISRITNRKGLIENLPQLAGAELGWAVDTRQLFIGNGTLQEGAPIIGNTEIINYTHKLECYNIWLMHIYNPVIKINNKKETNINLITQILINNEPNIYTNIIQNI